MMCGLKKPSCGTCEAGSSCVLCKYLYYDSKVFGLSNTTGPSGTTRDRSHSRRPDAASRGAQQHGQRRITATPVASTSSTTL